MAQKPEAWRKLYEALREALDGPLRRWASARLSDAFIGYSRAYTELDEGWCGTALTPRWLGPDPRRMPPLRPGRETPRSLARLVDRLHSPLAASLAVAAVNAATAAWIASEGLEASTRSPAELAESSDYAVMIGYMPGLAKAIARRAKKLIVIEAEKALRTEAARAGHQAYSPAEPGAWESLHKATLLIVTGSAVLDPPLLIEQLGHAHEADRRVLTGATSSFHPLIAVRLGFTHLAGTYIDPRLCPEARSMVAAGRGLHGVRGRLVHWLWPR